MECKTTKMSDIHSQFLPALTKTETLLTVQPGLPKKISSLRLTNATTTAHARNFKTELENSRQVETSRSISCRNSSNGSGKSGQDIVIVQLWSDTDDKQKHTASNNIERRTRSASHEETVSYSGSKTSSRTVGSIPSISSSLSLLKRDKSAHTTRTKQPKPMDLLNIPVSPLTKRYSHRGNTRQRRSSYSGISERDLRIHTKLEQQRMYMSHEFLDSSEIDAQVINNWLQTLDY